MTLAGSGFRAMNACTTVLLALAEICGIAEVVSLVDSRSKATPGNSLSLVPCSDDSAARLGVLSSYSREPEPHGENNFGTGTSGWD
jgi:hypothetical protein